MAIAVGNSYASFVLSSCLAHYTWSLIISFVLFLVLVQHLEILHPPVMPSVTVMSNTLHLFVLKKIN